MPRAVVVMPTYNEAENLDEVTAGLRRAAPEVDLLIVDDASPDGTGAIADRLAASDPQIRVLHRAEKAGLGAAYVAGFQQALALGYELIGQMDADGSHPVSSVPDLITEIEAGADMAIGSRWVPGGRVENWPWSRQLLSRGGNLYTRVLLGIRVRDATAGFRMIRRETLERIGLDRVQGQGYVFQVELAYRALASGARIVEVPITFTERVRGDSKMTPAVARESLRRITRWGLAERAGTARRGARRARRALARRG